MKRIVTVSKSKSDQESVPESITPSKSIQDGAKIRQFFQAALDQKALVHLWCPEEGAPPSVRTEILSLQVTAQGPMSPHFRVMIENPAQAKAWKAFLMGFRKEPTGRTPAVFFLVFSKRGGVTGFTARWLETDSWSFEIPEKIFSIPRRKSDRYEIPGGYEIYVRFQDPRKKMGQMSRRLFDLSAGGLSFFASHTEHHRYTKNLFLPKMKFRLRGREILFSGVVLSKVRVGIRYRVGVAFKKISKEDVEYIQSYVLEHLVQYTGGMD